MHGEALEGATTEPFGGHSQIDISQQETSLVSDCPLVLSLEREFLSQDRPQSQQQDLQMQRDV